ncbi:aminodeoxychorismate lyase [Nesterenkonia alba]|uniref:aminodeoxychorismate lyase n=1 Tax=Nesterenkonia alba TaxID=515814 RepID=UPI0003B5916E|nr:aminodeoxychorismate lyase [Nesterenkonia alba]
MAEHFLEDSVSAVAVRIDAEHPSGLVFDPHQPQLRVTDLGVVRGDGVFETMLARDGQVRKFEAHLQRLARSARLTEIGIPPAESWRSAVQRGLDEFRNRGGLPDEVTIRLTATRGVDGEPASDDPAFAGTYWALLSPVSEEIKAKRGAPIAVTLLDRGHDATAAERAPWLLLSAKTLSYAVNMAALRWAKSHGFDDVIFTTSDGHILEAPTSTVLLLRKNPDEPQRPTLLTPILETGILPGTTQGAIFTAAERAGWNLGYGPLTPEDLYTADHLWLVSSVRLASPVARVEDRELAVDPTWTQKLNEFLNQDLPVQHPTT